jgi:hypothetical protein
MPRYWSMPDWMAAASSESSRSTLELAMDPAMARPLLSNSRVMRSRRM